MAMSTPDRWFACFRPTPDAARRLFCFPYAGGSASIYRGWAEALGPKVEVWAVQLPGRGMRLSEPPFTRLGPEVQALTPAILQACSKPFAFFGHSMGALLAFEVARELRRQNGLLPETLIVSGRGAAHRPISYPPIYHLSDEAFREEVRRYNGTPAEVLANEELVNLLLPTLRADFTVSETYTYRPEPPLDCSIAALGGTLDDKVPQEHLEAWCELTRRNFSLHTFQGDHFFLNSKKGSVLQTVSQLLETVFR
jgi:medium-chain acyl-[acyl-carrier-protein] hydrolase